MTQTAKLLGRILAGRSDSSIGFDELCHLLTSLGFAVRIRGSHHIFSRGDVEEIINIQPIGSRAKAYQVKQVRQLILRHRLGDAE